MVLVSIVPAPALAQKFVVAEGGEAILEAPADSTSWAWSLDGDGAYDDCPNEPTCILSAAEQDGDSTFEIGLVTDRELQTFEVVVRNVPPVFTSLPPSNTRRGATYTYAPIVRDPGSASTTERMQFQLVDGLFPEGMVVDEATGVVTWIPRADQVGEQIAELRVEDDDGGSAVQTWSIDVRDNAAPSEPVLLYPGLLDCISVESPTFYVANGSDPDGDPLSYFFEADTHPSFRSGQLIQSPGIPEGASGFTTFQVPKPLEICDSYFWRAWTSDGAAESAKVAGLFQVCLYMDCEPRRERPEDCSMGDSLCSDDEPRPPIHDQTTSGCGCWPEPPLSSAPERAGLGLALVIFAGLTRPRRRPPR